VPVFLAAGGGVIRRTVASWYDRSFAAFDGANC